MFDLRESHVERTDSGDYRVRWCSARAGQVVRVYMSEDPERYYRGDDPGTPVYIGSGEEALVANPDKGVRHYFCLVSDAGEVAVLAERQLSLQGSPNFRDMGGYEGHEGRRLKWGKLYRSGKLSGLTEADSRYLEGLGVTLVCDLRQVVEQELEPSALVLPRVASLPVTPGSRSNFLDNLHRGIIAVDDASALMQDINREFVAEHTPQYAEMFRLLLSDHQQLLIHCASGKDRTGFGAALILDVLGVEEDRIIEDYLLTNRYLPIDEEVARLSSEFRDQSGLPVSEAVLRPLLEVRPEYIAACFEEIRKRYDSKEHFFATALDLDEDKLAQLRDRYLH